MKQVSFEPVESSERKTRKVSTEYIWETFDSVFKTLHRQGRRVEELEARILDLESRLQEKAAAAQNETHAVQPFTALSEMPAEKAA